MNILCSICTRGGSKGVKNKNFKKINNKYLFEYTLEKVKKIKKITNYIISTDSEDIIKILKKQKEKNWYLRKSSLSRDSSPKIPVIRDALLVAEKKYEKKFEIIIDLDVTSPLRTINDIRNCINYFINIKKGNLISVTKSKKNPYFNMIELNVKTKKIKLVKNNGKFYTRQNAPKVYDLNASIYIWDKNTLLKNNSVINNKTVIYEMPEERSIDIDSKLDFKIVKSLLTKDK